MKTLLFIFLILSTPSWALIKDFKPTDTVLVSGNPNTNYSANTVNTQTYAATDSWVGNFDLTSIAGQTATYAHFYLYAIRGAQHTSNVYRIVRDFTASQATYNAATSSVNWATAGALNSSTDYTTTHSGSYFWPNTTYQQIDLTAMINDCLSSGNNNCKIKIPEGTSVFDSIYMSGSANPPHLTIATGTPGTPNLWYVRDGGAAFGTDTTHCNGTVNVAYVANQGPNCAVSHPDYIVGNNGAAQWIAGDIMYIAGDSDLSFAFTVSGVTTGPKVGDTYTNNGITYTVSVPLATGKTSGKITATGSGAPQASGTLTRSAGAGDATITFSAEGAGQAAFATNTTITIPGGAPGQQTKIIGTGTQYPQFYSSTGSSSIIDATQGYIDLENLDITRRNNCIKNGPTGTNPNSDGFDYVCSGGDPVITTGVSFGGTGSTYVNMLVHNLFNGWNNSINGGVIGDQTFTNVKTFGNNSEGLSVGQGQATDNIMTGTMKFISSQFDYNGCGQRYPLQDTTDIFQDITKNGLSVSVDNPSNYYNCFGQGQGGYGDGVAFGPNGSANAGNWTVINSSISFNTQDGLDTLHGNGNGTIAFIRSRAEGNAGQQIKLNGKIEDIENSLINGNCARWVGAPESSTTLGSTLQSCATGFYISSTCFGGGGGEAVCRANGDVALFVLSAGAQVYFYNNTINANGIAIEGSGSGCDGTTGLHVKNNIVNGGAYAVYDGTISFKNNPQLVTYIYLGGSDGNGTGTCGPVGNGSGGVMTPDEDYNIVYNTKNNNQGCNGAHDKCGTAPGYSNTILMGTVSGAANTYYQGNAMVSLEGLAVTSGARGAAHTAGLTYTNGTNDYNNYANGVDLGGLAYGSAPTFCSGIGQACTIGNTCCSGFCVSSACAVYNCGDGIVTTPEVCDTSGPNLNSQTCKTQGFDHGTLACTAGCLTFDTTSCVGTCNANSVACTVDGDCCSGFCVSSVCSDHKCGNGTVEGSEVCDGSNLNSNTCNTVGAFTGGTLACNANCLTFNTSSCVASSGVNMIIGGNIKVN